MKKIVISFFMGCALYVLGFNAYGENIPNWNVVNGNLPTTQSNSQINTLAEFNQGLYIAGRDDNNQAYVYRYNGNMVNPVWSDVGNGLNAQSIDTLYIFDNKQLFAGGFNCPSAGMCHAVFAKYNGDDQQPRWTLQSIAGLPKGAIITKLVTFNGHIIALTNNIYTASDPIYMYNSVTQSWKSISSDLASNLISLSDIIVFQNKLYACGGNEGNASTALYVYNNIKSQWKLVNNGLPNNPFLLSSTAYSMAVFNNALYVGGSYSQNTYSSIGYVYVYNGNDENPQWTDQSYGLPVKGVDGGVGMVYKLMVNNNVFYGSGIDSYGNFFVYTFNKTWRQFGPVIPQTGYGLQPQTTALLIYNKAFYFSGNSANYPVIFGLMS